MNPKTQKNKRRDNHRTDVFLESWKRDEKRDHKVFSTKLNAHHNDVDISQLQATVEGAKESLIERIPAHLLRVLLPAHLLHVS